MNPSVQLLCYWDLLYIKYNSVSCSLVKNKQQHLLSASLVLRSN